MLEVESGSIGLGQFRNVAFTGCDIYFPGLPEPPMRGVVGSAADLPFEDRSFDAVIACDVLEHIPPEVEVKVVHQCLRVFKSVAIFGFPCGPPSLGDRPQTAPELLRYRRNCPPVAARAYGTFISSPKRLRYLNRMVN